MGLGVGGGVGGAGEAKERVKGRGANTEILMGGAEEPISRGRWAIGCLALHRPGPLPHVGHILDDEIASFSLAVGQLFGLTLMLVAFWAQLFVLTLKSS